MSKQETGNKLNGRDFINIGIYAAIYFVIVMALAMTGLIPIFLILLSSMVGIIGGIPFMLFLTKVKKPGMIIIMSLIMGILMFLTGMTWVPIPLRELLQNSFIGMVGIRVCVMLFLQLEYFLFGHAETTYHYFYKRLIILLEDLIMDRNILILS